MPLKILSCVGAVSTSVMCTFPWSEVTVNNTVVSVEMTTVYGSVGVHFALQSHCIVDYWILLSGVNSHSIQ